MAASVSTYTPSPLDVSNAPLIESPLNMTAEDLTPDYLHRQDDPGELLHPASLFNHGLLQRTGLFSAHEKL